MTRGFTAFAGVALAAALGVTACGSSTATSGTERFASPVMTGKQALGNTFTLTYTGPVTTTGTFNTKGSGPKVGQLHAFVTKAGTLMLKVARVPENKNAPGTAACSFTSTTVVDYTVDGAKSTGSFKDATGSGVVTVKFAGTGPKLKDGKCNPSNSAAPVSATASFVGSGPLTLHS